ncbi:MAG: hypothetical protein K9L86_04645 [Candidatus Omnitrophica bacterium]|nr:hypothetical protein [Candidatus Omnitrophota bacterium]
MVDRKLGIRTIGYFYLCLSILYGLPLFVFSTQLVIFGVAVSPFLAKIIHFNFLILFWFLYLAMREAKKSGFVAALFLHIIFLINGILIANQKTAFLKIEGLRATRHNGENLIVVLGIVINILIIIYLMKRKAYFVDNV